MTNRVILKKSPDKDSELTIFEGTGGNQQPVLIANDRASRGAALVNIGQTSGPWVIGAGRCLIASTAQSLKVRNESTTDSIEIIWGSSTHSRLSLDTGVYPLRVGERGAIFAVEAISLGHFEVVFQSAGLAPRKLITDGQVERFEQNFAEAMWTIKRQPKADSSNSEAGTLPTVRVSLNN